MATKSTLSEQCQRIYARFLDKDNPSDVIDIREVMLLVSQAINKILKLEVAESFKAGLVDIPKCSLIQYTATMVSEPANNRSYVVLPVIPLTLPLDMGIWSISASNAAMTPYIPIPAQDVLVFQGANLSYLEGQIGYYVQGKSVSGTGARVYFTKDLTLAGNGSIPSVLISILASDFSQFGDNDMLPISPEVESAVIAEVLNIISGGRVSQAEMASQQEGQ
jgi:hypothetical protein